MAAAAAPARQFAQHRPQRREAILVVEDQAFVREAICELLESRNYDVLDAENAESAMKVFSACEGQIDLVFCDAVLPDSNGVLLIQRLRQLCHDLKVLLTSGYPMAQLPPEFVRAQEMHLLVKPYSGAVLIAKLETMLRPRHTTGATSVCGPIVDGFEDDSGNII